MMFDQTTGRWYLLLVLCTTIASSALGIKTTFPTFVSVPSTTNKQTTASSKLHLASNNNNNNNNKNNDPSSWTKTREVQWKTRDVSQPLPISRTRPVPESTSSSQQPDIKPLPSSSEEEEESSELAILNDLTFQEYIETIWNNMAGGEPGKRGELYFGTQTALVLLVLMGEVPLVGEPLKFALGSGAIFGGVGAIIAGVVELGDQLSAWPVPPSNAQKDDSQIVDTGIYSLVRHPIYAGLISICGGLGFVTDNTMRIFFTILLYYCLEKKSEFEELKIIDEDPSYILYREEVRGKFIPHEIVEALPWEEKK